MTALAAAACTPAPNVGEDATPSADGSPPPQDAMWSPEAAAPLFAEVTVSGCTRHSVEPAVIHCQGPAPLALSFAALVPESTEQYVWDFGDGSAPSALAAPRHVFTQPGTYLVTLVLATPSGLVGAARPVEVSVTTAPLGAYCAADAQCAGGRCLCGEDTGAQGCPPALSGTCSAPCPDCGNHGVCADLTVPDATALPDWRSLTCLPDCGTDVDCARPGFSCLSVPTRDATGTRRWGTACLPDLLAPLGGRCAGPDGTPDGLACWSGTCLPLGRFGLCAEPCPTGACPPGADCARFSESSGLGEPVCLMRCDGAHACTDDPALACTAPDPSGVLGFEILSAAPPPGTTYCAPRRCTADAECPSGLCDLAAGGFCL